MFDEIIKNLVYDFICNEDYYENEIETKLIEVLKKEILNLSSINVYLYKDTEFIKIRIYFKLKKNYDFYKYNYDYDCNYLINSKRRKNLKLI
jgi:hypothetical protein